mmetsp:Transcript_2112/g.6275  ORF Transcript_2112/g.6275 Transcript_2112/m.6275 type:complete len:136 (+) Transcript_2112:380-787(+)
MASLDDRVLTDIELDTVRSLDETSGSSWCSWILTSCSPCASICAPYLSTRKQRTNLPPHLSDPLLLGPPVARVPDHIVTCVMDREAHGASRSHSPSRHAPGQAAGLELKATAPNPLLGQWHRVGDRPFIAPRPYL